MTKIKQKCKEINDLLGNLNEKNGNRQKAKEFYLKSLEMQKYYDREIREIFLNDDIESYYLKSINVCKKLFSEIHCLTAVIYYKRAQIRLFW